MQRRCVIPSAARTSGSVGRGGNAAAVGVVAAAELCGSGVDCRRVFLLFLPIGRSCSD